MSQKITENPALSRLLLQKPLTDPQEEKAFREVFPVLATLVNSSLSNSTPEKLLSRMVKIASSGADKNAFNWTKLQRQLSEQHHTLTQANNFKDTLNNFVEHLLFPTLVHKLYLKKKDNTHLSEGEAQKIKNNLRETAFNLFFTQKNGEPYPLCTLLKMSLQEHAYGSQKIAPEIGRIAENGNVWYALTEPFKHNGITMHALTTDVELVNEGKTMHHCVGGGDYTIKCKNGKSHIYHLEEKNGEKSTVEFGIYNATQKSIRVLQHHSFHDSSPTNSHLEVVKAFQKELKDGKLKVSNLIGQTQEAKNRIANQREGNAFELVLRYLAYEPTLKNLAVALKCYNSDLLSPPTDEYAKKQVYGLIGANTPKLERDTKIHPLRVFRSSKISHGICDWMNDTSLNQALAEAIREALPWMATALIKNPSTVGGAGGGDFRNRITNQRVEQQLDYRFH